MSDKQRLIDANALKKELDAWASPIRNRKFYVRDDAICVIDASPTIDAVPQWIPVTERLPEDMDDVIVTDADGSALIGQYDEEDNAWRDDMEIEVDYIIAWMPLPEPYQAKVDGKDGDSE